LAGRPESGARCRHYLFADPTANTMSTQVLARKWRPKSFDAVIGQEHVVRALTHALDARRLHHAYLFTGTRGVGKTTLSRLLAKALNCTGGDDKGDVTSTPCGVCSACLAIDSGRFIDYIEMDAASNRGVDEMAQLLEQAIYAPSAARFKVYMIDEVHMLTGHAFNAMLKTLEEPPDHLKFILATTDPQKIPVTVLSRCLQFNLKQMPTAQIVAHLAAILAAETIPFEDTALPRLARAAAGSMRDALSLTDQAIAFGGGSVTHAGVQGMLGSLDESYIFGILQALANRDGSALIAIVDEIAARSLSMGQALLDLALALQRIALLQAVPNASGAEWAGREILQELALRFNAEEIQLDYDIAVRGRAEMPMAPDEYAGFSMTLMRMLAFAPIEDDAPSRALTAPPVAPALAMRKGTAAVTQEASAVAGRGTAADASGRAKASGAAQAHPKRQDEAAAGPMPGAALATTAAAVDAIDFDGNWPALARRVNATGLARQLLEQAELLEYGDNLFKLRVALKHLAETQTVEKLRAALSQHFATPVRLHVSVGAITGATHAVKERAERDARQADAVAAIESDPFVKTLVSDFGGVVVPGSIRPRP
jgi:DNA polymerase-3 subunit gamma/tau